MRRRVSRVVLVTIAILVAAAVSGTAASASPWVGVWIQSAYADACVSVPGAVDGAAATQESCVDVNTQLWTFDDAGPGGTYRVRNFGTGKCLTASGTSSGSPVQQYPCASIVSQSWTLNGTGNTFRIVNVASGNCLARTNTTITSALVHGSCTLFAAQWKLLY